MDPETEIETVGIIEILTGTISQETTPPIGMTEAEVERDVMAKRQEPTTVLTEHPPEETEATVRGTSSITESLQPNLKNKEERHSGKTL